MATFESFRDDRYLWGARLLQLLFALIILGVTGEGASLWKSIDCNVPSKLGFNIAAGALMLIATIYLIFSSGPKSFQRVPWNHWLVISIDAFFLIIWIAATATSVYDCNGICSACSPVGRLEDVGYGFWVQYGSMFCSCVFDTDIKLRNKSRAPTSLANRGLSPGAGTSRDLAALAEKSANIAAKRGLDIVMIFLSIVTLWRSIDLVYKARKSVTGGNRATEHGAPEAYTAVPRDADWSNNGPKYPSTEYRVFEGS